MLRRRRASAGQGPQCCEPRCTCAHPMQNTSGGTRHSHVEAEWNVIQGPASSVAAATQGLKQRKIQGSPEQRPRHGVALSCNVSERQAGTCLSSIGFAIIFVFLRSYPTSPALRCTSCSPARRQSRVVQEGFTYESPFPSLRSMDKPSSVRAARLRFCAGVL